MSCSLPLVLQESKELNLEEEVPHRLGVVQTHPRAERVPALFTCAPVVVQKPTIQAGQGQPTAPAMPEHRGEGKSMSEYGSTSNVLMDCIRRTKLI